MKPIVAVVLAAGRGERIGGPKALLAWLLLPHRWLVPLAAAHVESRTECERVIVVTREDIAVRLRHHAAISFGAAGRGELCISQADDALGPAGSIAAAAAVIEGDPLILLTPVDCPPAQHATVLALVAALDDETRVAAKPRFAGRGGHPIAARASILSHYRGASPPPLRDLLRSLGDAVVEVDVPDAGVCLDFDDREALEAYGRAYGGGPPDEPAFFD